MLVVPILTIVTVTEDLCTESREHDFISVLHNTGRGSGREIQEYKFAKSLTSMGRGNAHLISVRKGREIRRKEQQTLEGEKSCCFEADSFFRLPDGKI